MVLLYLTAGMSVVWAIDPLTHNVAVYLPFREPEVVKAPAVPRDDLLPGLEIPLAELFAMRPT